MSLTPAYAVNGGRVPAEMLRMTLYASTSGATGVVNVGDLKVTALSTPGGSVNIAPGAALMANRFAGVAKNQSYAAANDATMTLDIPATGSSGGRTDYIILRIDDWHYSGGSAPADPVNALYCSFQRVSQLAGIAYPYVALAKITVPASTAAITNAMITDIRDVALPRQKRVMRVGTPNPTKPETLAATAAKGEYFPNDGFQQNVSVPEWATRVFVRADWAQLLMPAGDNAGQLWVEYGPWDAANTRYKYGSDHFYYDSAKSSDPSRTTVTAVGNLAVPADIRGTDTTFVLYGQKIRGTGVGIDAASGFSLDLLFVEQAE